MVKASMNVVCPYYFKTIRVEWSEDALREALDMIEQGKALRDINFKVLVARVARGKGE